MDGEHYHDPMRDALDRAAGHTAQLASLLAVTVQVGVDIQRRRAEIAQTRDLAARRHLEQQAHAVRQAARARWAPAHDRRWLGDANLLDVARIWSAAVPTRPTTPPPRRPYASAKSGCTPCTHTPWPTTTGCARTG